MSSPPIVDVPPELLKLITPFSLVAAGPSGSGKSKMLFELLDNITQCTSPPIERVVFIYGVYQDLYKEYPNIRFTGDITAMETRHPPNTLLIIDDCMSAIKDDSALEHLFTRGRHEQVSTILVLQNMFYKGSVMKTCRDNATYLAFTNHLQDQNRMRTFASQLEGEGGHYFKESYEDAIKTRFNYLFVDLHPKSLLRYAPYFIKYRSGVHKPEGQTLYIDKKKHASYKTDEST